MKRAFFVKHLFSSTRTYGFLYCWIDARARLLLACFPKDKNEEKESLGVQMEVNRAGTGTRGCRDALESHGFHFEQG